MNARKNQDPIERFFDSTDVLEDGCWQWTKNLEPYGYGHFSISATPFAAHRFSYWLFKGDVPAGLCLDHLCRNRGCVNPDHLEAVTTRENVLRGIGPAAQAARSTECPQGHPYDKRNIRGNRICNRCNAAAVRKCMERKPMREQYREYYTVYGNPSGVWALLESPEGWIPPPKVNDLTYLGGVHDVFTALNYHLKQSQIARLIGVAQPAVSRYINASFMPGIDSNAWARLISEYFSVCLLKPDHRHTIELYRQNVDPTRTKAKSL